MSTCGHFLKWLDIKYLVISGRDKLTNFQTTAKLYLVNG